MKVTYLSQLDPRWSKNLLGSGPLTIGRYGCTTTVLSMMSFWVGKPMLPPSIAANKGWYTDSNYPGGPGLILWNKLQIPGLKFKERVRAYDRAKILKDLADPKMLVGLQVNNGQHWVWLLSKVPLSQDFYCADPNGGVKCKVFGKYHNITGSVHFEII